MRLSSVIVLSVVSLVGCKSAPQSDSWVGRQWSAAEQGLEGAVSSAGKEAMRHYAASAMLVVLAVGCWARVRHVSRRNDEFEVNEGREDL